MPPKRILIITAGFYPTIAVGALRLESFIRHLAARGWDCHVLTKGEGPEPDWGQASVIRVTEPWHKSRQALRQTLDNRNPLFPERSAPAAKLMYSLATLAFVRYWSNAAAHAAEGLLGTGEIPYIFATAPGIETLLAGAKLKRRHPGLCLIGEFRDILAYNRVLFNRMALNDWAESRMERFCSRHIDKYVFLTPGIEAHYRALYPVKRAQVIPNKITAVNPAPESSPDAASFSFCHTGSFYGSRNPLQFLTALGQVLNQDAYAALKPMVRVKFAGRMQREILTAMQDIIAAHRLEDNVTFLGVLEHSRAQELTFGADVNLLITHTRGSEYAIPAKFFEYLGARRPVLALTRDRLVLELIADGGLGWHAPPDDPEALKRIIRYLFDNMAAVKTRVITESRLAPYLEGSVNQALEDFIIS